MTRRFLDVCVLSELEILGGKLRAQSGTQTRQLWSGCHPQSVPFLSSSPFCVLESPLPPPLGLPQDSCTPRTWSREGELWPGSSGGAAGCGPRGKFTGAVGTSLPQARPWLSRPGPAAAGEACPSRCRRVTPAPGVANRKRKSRGAGVFPLIRFTL